MDKWSPRTWHRKASRPVSIWMMVFLVAGASHILIPNYRWVLIHLFTLGILTNSIVVWSQHLTEKFVQLRLPDSARPRQLARIYLLNAGVIVVLLGQLLVQAWNKHWILTQIGATLVGAAVLWHGATLFGLWRQAESKRFRPVVAAYVASAFFLAVGAVLGALLAVYPAHPRLLIAHVTANVGGFVGLAAAGSLTILFPSIWRTKGVNPRMNLSFALLSLGVIATLIGSVWNIPEVGLIIYCLGWLASLEGWLVNVLTVAEEPRGRVTFPALSALFAALWLVGGLTYYTAQHFFTDEPKIPMLALVVGFAAQLLVGVMSYLMPTTMGGGPSAVRAGLQEYNRWGIGRSVFINGGLALWLATSSSLTMVIASLLSLGSMALLPVLTARAVKAQKAVLQKKAEGPAPATATDWNQALIALGVLVLVGALSFVL
ncbi:copper oxidase [Corynebacterium sp. BF-R-2]|uniref:copper oxidase n=1 Tax=Corynebacterium sp. BF-R-2 TaxID=2943494 RepID=UPI00211ECF77|nr:copper oxidase [Corynebacterium sp. BF-R-2]MCQ9676433.1 copper oxidase [Corynebacterium sp. BF-R-2]